MTHQPADTPKNLPTGKEDENQPLDDMTAATNRDESTAPRVQELQLRDPDQTEVRVESNTELIDRVMQLESELAVAQRQLQLYQEHCQAQEARLSGQCEELKSLKKQHSQLLEEKELGQQTSQRQQIIIETITEQLETNQQQVAQLERDCALTQQRCDEQRTKLSQAETICRDLRSRLYRQQRYTLQFKNALEKCLEMSNPERSPETRDSHQNTDLRVILQGFVPKSPAIKPWSATSELAQLELEPGLNDTVPTIRKPDYGQISADIPTSERSDGEQQEQLVGTEVSSDRASTSKPDSGMAPLTLPEPEQLEDVEWLESDPWTEEVNESAPTAATPDPESEEIDSVESSLTQQESQVSADIRSRNGSENAETLSLLSGTNSPSPLVYPLRPHKKIKSLAAIDLPTFPRSAV